MAGVRHLQNEVCNGPVGSHKAKRSGVPTETRTPPMSLPSCRTEPTGPAQGDLQNSKLRRPPRAVAVHTARLARRRQPSPPHPRRDRHAPTPRSPTPTTTPINTQVLASKKGSVQGSDRKISIASAPTKRAAIVQNTGHVARSGKAVRFGDVIGRGDWNMSTNSVRAATAARSSAPCGRSRLPAGGKNMCRRTGWTRRLVARDAPPIPGRRGCAPVGRAYRTDAAGPSRVPAQRTGR